MFIYDKPIETEKDDFLGRKKFSQHLGKALLDWKENESLVIAIYGEWGSGKSSIINLARETINQSNDKNKPTIIEFNPWIFSEESNLGKHFFNEIAKELAIKNDTKKDTKIAKKLKYYASLLSLTPSQNQFSTASSKLFLLLGLIGITSGQIISWLNVPPDWIKNILIVGGIVLLLIEFLQKYLVKLATFFEKKTDYTAKSVFEEKKEIIEELIKRQKKIIIIIDDIDRLNQQEIRKIFRLIRVNADFPNTIYLLAFDRLIIEKNLEEQAGVSGKDYLNKIIQVNFHVPFINESKILTYLFKELDRILATLPKSAQKYFNQDDPYWANVYYSGFKNFFKNIRDVKRFISSLEFNISQMFQGEVMEVNPVDFIAIEAIRVFIPDFYSFMRDKNSLFTETQSSNTSNRYNEIRKEALENGLKYIPDSYKKAVLELLERLFPPLKGILTNGNYIYGEEWQLTWSKDLRICASNNYDSYFTLIPGGDEDELSRFEIDEILNKTNSEEEFKSIINTYIENKKIRKVLRRIQDFTSDQIIIPQEYVKNIVKVLFDISDNLSDEKVGMFDFGSSMDLMRIIYQLMKREVDKNKNYELLKEVIPLSVGLYGPIEKISIETSRKEKSKNIDDSVIPEEKIEELQQLCLKKIINTEPNDLINHKKLIYILYRWKEWDKNERWKSFLESILKEEEKLILFLNKFITEHTSQSAGDYGVRIIKKFNFKSLSNFFDLSIIKKKIEEIKKRDDRLYQNNIEIIDLFLNDFDKKDQDGL